MRNVERTMSTGWILAASFLAALFFTGATGCTDEESKEAAQPVGPAAETWSIEEVPELTLTDDGKVVPGPVQPQAGCSVVEWCNAPGADGARCLQQGCTLERALDECTAEARAACGTPVPCPWIFVASDGTRYIRRRCT